MADIAFLDLTKTQVDGSSPRREQIKTPGGVPFWGEVPRAWDVVKLAGVELPGLCEVNGKVSQKVDRKQVPGQNGAKYTQLGYQPADVDITVRLWTEDHLRAFEKLVKQVRPRGMRSTPDRTFTGPLQVEQQKKLERQKAQDKLNAWGVVDIAHPVLAIFGIKAVMVMKISFPKEKGECTGIFESRIECEEFVSPKAAKKGGVTTPTSSVGILDGIGPSAITPQVDARLEAQKKPSSGNRGP